MFRKPERFCTFLRGNKHRKFILCRLIEFHSEFFSGRFKFNQFRFRIKLFEYCFIKHHNKFIIFEFRHELVIQQHFFAQQFQQKT